MLNKTMKHENGNSQKVQSRQSFGKALIVTSKAAKTDHPFSNVFSTNGSATSPFSFMDEYTDSSGMLNLRAREYNPKMGRFLQPDPWPGSLGLSQSQGTYAMTNPILYIDPSGTWISFYEMVDAVSDFVSKAVDTVTDLVSNVVDTVSNAVSSGYQ
jgi:RHS repeat-associated protein